MSKSHKNQDRGTEIVVSTLASKVLIGKPYASNFLPYLHEFLSKIGADWAYVSKSGKNGVQISIVWHS